MLRREGGCVGHLSTLNHHPLIDMANTDATLTRTACNTYTITNVEAEATIGFVVKELVDGVLTTVYTSGSINPEEDESYTFENDGIFQITIGWSGSPLTNTDNYIVIIYCAVETCMLNYINSIVCDLDTDCAKCTAEFEKVLYYYNALNQTWFVFMAIQNDIYVNNYIFTGTLSAETLANLATASDLLTQITNYCNCLSLITDSTGSSGCGCG